MKVDLIVVGKTDQAEVRSLVAAYLKRLNFYAKVTLTGTARPEEYPEPVGRKPEAAGGRGAVAAVRRGRLCRAARRKRSPAALGRFRAVAAKADEQRITQALFRDRRALRFLAESVRAGRRSVVAFGHDLFPSDRARPFRRAALPGLYDYPQRALSSRIVRYRFAEPALCRPERVICFLRAGKAYRITIAGQRMSGRAVEPGRLRRKTPTEPPSFGNTMQQVEYGLVAFYHGDKATVLSSVL